MSTGMIRAGAGPAVHSSGETFCSGCENDELLESNGGSRNERAKELFLTFKSNYSSKIPIKHILMCLKSIKDQPFYSMVEDIFLFK